VSLSDGFKCTRCDYADACDDRVQQYKRVGRLIVEPPPPPPADVVMTHADAERTPPAKSYVSGAADVEEPMTKRQKKEGSNSEDVMPMDITMC
jgi:hypothetical protein